jgi:hypothetical protein
VNNISASTIKKLDKVRVRGLRESEYLSLKSVVSCLEWKLE